MAGRDAAILVDRRLELSLVHWLFRPRHPETPLFQGAQVEHHPINLVRQDSDEESSYGVENVVVGSGHDDEEDEHWVSERDCSDELVRRVEEEG